MKRGRTKGWRGGEEEEGVEGGRQAGKEEEREVGEMLVVVQPT